MVPATRRSENISRFLVALAVTWFAAAGLPAQQPPPSWSQLRGVNYFPAMARNAHDMWRHFDPVTADRELRWAHNLGFTSVRLWLSVPTYQEDAAGFERDLRQCLDLCQKHHLSAMLVLFDSCGVEPRQDATDVPVREAYAGFLASARFSHEERQVIAARYGQFAAGRGQDMLVPVGSDTPYDILFWQFWAPNPGLRRLLRGDWSDLYPYVDSALTIGKDHPAVIAFDIMNEPGSLFDIPQGVKLEDARKQVTAFVHHFAEYLRARYPQVIRTVGSSDLDGMRAFAAEQDVLSFHSYALGKDLKNILQEARDFAAGAGKPLLLTECLANTDNWLKVHGEESRSTDEAQLQHYRETLPILLDSGIGWYSWGFLSGGGFTPFTDILYPNGYRRPAAVYLQEQLRRER
ncbi:MAG: hypothetical protein MUF48_18750 [Pirellulaceae bacterium]|jgi:hypothetical protein|nr:hypothetical protein [Pirellulaceae bacterium]